MDLHPIQGSRTTPGRFMVQKPVQKPEISAGTDGPSGFPITFWADFYSRIQRVKLKLAAILLHLLEKDEPTVLYSTVQ